MTRIFSILLLSLLTTHLFAQQVPCNCELLINPTYFGKVPLYDQPNGKVLRSLRNDSLNEDYLLIKVEKDSADYFYGAVSYAISGKSWKGWIKKKKYVGTYSRNYGPKLILYTEANEQSKPVCIIKEHVSKIGLCTVLKCSNMWVYVKLSNGKREFKGWLSPDMQCASAYTTCN